MHFQIGETIQEHQIKISIYSKLNVKRIYTTI